MPVMMYIRFLPSLRQVEDPLHERGIDICHETVRVWWNRFGPMFAAEPNPAKEHERIDLEKARLEFAQLKTEIADQESDALADSFEHISKSAISASAAGRKDAQAVTKMAQAEMERRRLGRGKKV